MYNNNCITYIIMHNNHLQQPQQPQQHISHPLPTSLHQQLINNEQYPSKQISHSGQISCKQILTSQIQCIICSLSLLAKNQAYMEYKDYLHVRKCYEKYYEQINWIIGGRVKAISAYRVQCLYHILLITAKSYYMQKQYKKCLQLLTKQLNLSLNIPYTFKFLYQRQTLLLKSIYLFTPTNTTSLQKVYQQYKHHKNDCIDWSLIEGNVYVYDQNVSQLYKCVKLGSLQFRNQQHIHKTKNNFNMNSKLNPKSMSKINTVFPTTSTSVPTSSQPQSSNIIPSIAKPKIYQARWLQRYSQYIKQQKNIKIDLTQSSYIHTVNYPGPALNLQLINHIFQFQKHRQLNKHYMDTLLFPVIQNIDYYILSRRQWEYIYDIFGGIPIQRYPIRDGMFTEQDLGMNDMLVKIILECQGQEFVQQWQYGMYWQMSVLRVMEEDLGMGQVKEIIVHRVKNKGESNNSQQISPSSCYKQYKVVPAGPIGPSKNRYKYIQFDQTILGKIQQNRLKQIQTRYDLQQYPPEYQHQQQHQQQQQYEQQQEYSLGIIGIGRNKNNKNNINVDKIVSQYIGSIDRDILNKYIDNINAYMNGYKSKQPTKDIKYKNKNISNMNQIINQTNLIHILKQYISNKLQYINPIIHSLSCIAQLAQFYYSNRYIAKLNINININSTLIKKHQIYNNNMKSNNNKRSVNVSRKKCSDLQFSIAFADIVKKLWFSSRLQPYIGGDVFVQELIKEIINNIINKQFVMQLAPMPIPMSMPTTRQNISPSNPYILLKHMLSSLHQDINQCTIQSQFVNKIHSQSHQSHQPVPLISYNSYSKLQNYGIKNYMKIQNSYVQSLFNQYYYQMQVCKQCGNCDDYKLKPDIAMNININANFNINTRQHEEQLKLYFVYGTNQGKLQENNKKIHNNINNNNKLDRADSVKNLITEQSLQYTRGNKIVQQITIKLKSNKSLSYTLQLIRQKFNIDQLSLLTGNKYILIPVIVNQNIDQWIQIRQNTGENQGAGKRRYQKYQNIEDEYQRGSSVTVAQINQLLSNRYRAEQKKINQQQNKSTKSKRLLFVFLVNQPQGYQQLSLITYRNPSTKKNKGYPQIIISQKIQQYKNKQSLNYQNTKLLIKSKLYNQNIQIQDYQIERYKKEQNNAYTNTNTKNIQYYKQNYKNKICIKSCINVYTNTKIGGVNRSVIKMDIIDNDINENKDGDKGKDKGQGQGRDKGRDRGNIVTLQQCIKDMYSYENMQEMDNEYQQIDNAKKYQQKHCVICNKVTKIKIMTKLLQTSKILIISINQNNPKTPTLIKYPINGLNLNFLFKQPLLTRRKYNLKAMIIEVSRDKYACIAKNGINGQWYYFEDEKVQRIKVQQVQNGNRQIEMFVYERSKQYVMNSNTNANMNTNTNTNTKSNSEGQV